MSENKIGSKHMFIAVLAEYPHFVKTIAKIYMDEWSWHYESECGITTLEEMTSDILDHHLHNIMVLLDDDAEFIGTFAILECDLVSHSDLSPWLASLYVIPSHRNRGIGKMLVDFACNELMNGKKIYLWCYQEREKLLYTRYGFKLHNSFVHPVLNRLAYVMCR
jgi:GNAT superfamily N-acetyltransferase